MAIETDADRALFLDADEFGVAVAYHKVGAPAAISIAAIFDAEHVFNDGGEGLAVASVSPQIIVRSSDLPSGAGDGDAVTVSGTDYTVRYSEPDGTGMTVLKLERN